MNIALFNDSFYPQIDGVAKTVENYARIINALYGNSYVVVPRYQSRDTNDFSFPVWEYPSANFNIVDQYRVGIPISANLRQRFKGLQVDIVHSHCPFVSGIYAQRMASRKGAPHISTFHSKYKDDVNQRIKTKLGLPGEMVAKYVSAFYKKCDYVWTVNFGTEKTLREYGFNGEIKIIPNGCDMPVKYFDKQKREEFVIKHKLNADSPILLFVGRHSWTKNVATIIKALGALHRSKLKFNMVFVGSGESKSGMESMVFEQGINDHVVFLGSILGREELSDIYSISDLLIFPSVYDNAPLVVREAAACGCGALMIKGSNSAEDSIHNVNSFLTENTIEDVALTIKAAIDGGNLSKVGQNARRDIYKSWNDVLEITMEEYANICSKWDGKYKSSHIPLEKNKQNEIQNISIYAEYNLDINKNEPKDIE